MPVLVSRLHPFVSLFVIRAYLDLEPDHSCACVSISVEHHFWQYVISHIHQEVILVGQLIGRLPFASLCGFDAFGMETVVYMGTRTRSTFLGSFKFRWFTKRKRNGPGTLIYQHKITFILGGGEDGYVSYICMWNSWSRTNLCGL